MSSKFKMLVTIGIAALIATPALAGQAQTKDPTKDPNTVVRWDGKIAGKDPDANIRFQLLRDAFANEN